MLEAFLLIFILLGLMILIYLKVGTEKVIKFPLLTSIELFSLILSIDSFQYEIVGTPYLQIFFITFQSVIFIMSSLDYYNLKKLRDD